MVKPMNQKRMIIAGPCSAESRDQVLVCANALKDRGVNMMRASLWKPRTKPGFEGVGLEGSAWFAEATNLGVTIGTEILMPDQVTGLLAGIRDHHGNPANILLWIGSRNQNHVLQREIAKRILDEAPTTVKLLIKNQPWSDELHWLGIIDHVMDTGITPDRIILCHRGFSPNGGANPDGFRNIPDFDMAMRVKAAMGLPMLLDPSHIGGSVENVFKVIEMAASYDFDGLMVEIHSAPASARTDAKQQLSFQELDKVLNFIQ
jgi:3-deoxy-D-arabino-heptulosonate 7-phosphate (DAHP) synthase